jgi:hypothetical protein
MIEPALTEKEKRRAWAYSMVDRRIESINKALGPSRAPWIPSKEQFAKLADELLEYVESGS